MILCLRMLGGDDLEELGEPVDRRTQALFLGQFGVEAVVASFLQLPEFFYKAVDQTIPARRRQTAKAELGKRTRTGAKRQNRSDRLIQQTADLADRHSEQGIR